MSKELIASSPIHPHLLESPDSPLHGVQIWMAQVESIRVAELDHLQALLDSMECGRAARFHFQRDRQNYIATRGLLRILLGVILQKNGSELVFQYGPHGKPALAATEGNQPPIHFNITHSAGWAMFAVSSRSEVGLDLEAEERLTRDESNLNQLAARILSPNELSIWRALPDASARTSAFLRAWTRKEAYTKAIGRGLLEMISQVEVALDAAAPKSLLILPDAGKTGQNARNWFLYDLTAPPGFTAALAVAESSGQNPGGA